MDMQEIDRDLDKLFEKVQTLEETLASTMENLVHLQETVISLQDSFAVVTKATTRLVNDKALMLEDFHE